MGIVWIVIGAVLGVALIASMAYDHTMRRRGESVRTGAQIDTDTLEGHGDAGSYARAPGFWGGMTGGNLYGKEPRKRR